MRDGLEQFPRWFGPFTLLARLEASGGVARYFARSSEGPSRLRVTCWEASVLGDEVREAFLRAGRQVARTRRTDVLGVLATGSVGGRMFVASDHFQGVPVERLFGPLKPVGSWLDWTAALAWVGQLVDAVERLNQDYDEATWEALRLPSGEIRPCAVWIGEGGALKLAAPELGLFPVGDETMGVVRGDAGLGTRYVIRPRGSTRILAQLTWALLTGTRPRPGVRLSDFCPEISSSLAEEVELALEGAHGHEFETLKTAVRAELKRHGKQIFDSAATFVEVGLSSELLRQKRVYESAEALPEPSKRETAIQKALAGAVSGSVLAQLRYARGEGFRSLDRAALWLAEQPRRLRLILAGMAVASLLLALALILKPARKAAKPPAAVAEAAPVLKLPPVPEAAEAMQAARLIEQAEAAPAPALAEAVPASTHPRVPREKVVRKRKREVAERLQRMRRRYFEPAYQKELTKLGRRLSRARTLTAVRSVEDDLRSLDEKRR